MSASRKAFILCILILLFYGLTELLALGGFYLLNRRMFSWSELQAQRFEAVHGDPEEKLRHSLEKKVPAAGAEEQTTPQRGAITEIIHPYLGFVLNKSRPDCSTYGFLDRRVLDNPTAPVSVKTPDNYIVLVIGGSFAYGTSIASSKGYLEDQLRTLPGLKDKKIIVHTVAVGGYKQPQQLLALNYFLSLGAHFDLILEIDGFNEVALPESENLSKGVNPFFPRVWWMRVGRINDPEMLVSLAQIELVKERRRNMARLFSAFPLRASVTANLFWQQYDQYADRRAKKMEEDFTRAKTQETKKLRYVATGPPYSAKNDAELYRDLAGVWSRSSRVMQEISRANGIDYFHFLQPNQYVAGSKPMSAEERNKAWRDDNAYKAGVEKGYPYLIEAGRQLAAGGVEFHDLTGMFADNREVLYRDSCCHLNEKGYDMVIDRIIGAIRDKEERDGLLSLPKQ